MSEARDLEVDHTSPEAGETDIIKLAIKRVNARAPSKTDSKRSDPEMQVRGFLPSFDGLKRFRRHLDIHMRRVGIREQIFKTLDGGGSHVYLNPNNNAAVEDTFKFLNDLTKRMAMEEPVDGFLLWYKKAPFINLPGGVDTKRNLRKKLKNEKIHPGIDAVYRMIRYAYDLYKAGLGYVSNTDGNEKTRMYGEIFMEVASVYMQRITGIAFGIDAQLVMGSRADEDGLVEKLFSLAGVPSVDGSLEESGIFERIQEIDAVLGAVEYVRSGADMAGSKVAVLEASAAPVAETAGESNASKGRDPQKGG